MASRKGGRRSRQRRKSRLVAPTNIREYRTKSAKFQDLWNRVTNAISKMRSDGTSLRQACQEFALNQDEVVRLANPALRKRKNGDYAVKPADDLLRVLVIPTADGLREIGLRDSRLASVVGKYWAAVQRYLETGDPSALRKIRRKTVTDADGKRISLIKDLAELDRLGSAGVLSFESIYAKAA
jgi:hypothetical protein